MKLACLCFTKEGEHVASRICEYDPDVDIYTRENYKQNLDNMFSRYDGIVFISSTGIAVRMTAPYLKSKTTDPAIVVIDDLARYVISLVSGHLGGANQLAEELARFLKCQPIITTASDSRGIEAIDMFAKKNGWTIGNMEHAKIITAMMLEQKPMQILVEHGGQYQALAVDDMKSEKLRLHYPHLTQGSAEGYLYLTSKGSVTCPDPHVVIHPKILNVGIGCKKGKSSQEILDAIQTVFEEHDLSLESIQQIATIELKRHEPGIIEACEVLKCGLQIFSNEAIEAVQDQFSTSNWVKTVTGVTGVCEPCCYLAGGELIINKTAINGVTVAVSRETLYG